MEDMAKGDGGGDDEREKAEGEMDEGEKDEGEKDEGSSGRFLQS
jgi:hypothetical protein